MFFFIFSLRLYLVSKPLLLIEMVLSLRSVVCYTRELINNNHFNLNHCIVLIKWLALFFSTWTFTIWLSNQITFGSSWKKLGWFRETFFFITISLLLTVMVFLRLNLKNHCWREWFFHLISINTYGWREWYYLFARVVCYKHEHLKVYFLREKHVHLRFYVRLRALAL